MPINSWSDTSISITIPSGATTGNVVVTVGGVSSNGVQFTVTSGPSVPTITSLNPFSGPVGTSVTITGTNFDSSGTVTFNGIAATPTSWSSTSIVVPVPSGATSGNVIVTTSAGTSNGMSFTVTTAPGPPTGGTTFNLKSITGGVIIPGGGTYGGQNGISLFCTQPWSPSVTLAVGASVYVAGTGSYDGYFTLAGISTGPDNYGMTLAASSNANTNIVLQQGTINLGGTPGGGGGGGGPLPTLTSISPTSGAANTAAVVTFSGTGFTGATATTYSGTGITRANLQVASDTSLSTTFGLSSSATSGNVSVSTPAGTSNTQSFSVTAAVPPAGPLINSVSPTSGNASSTVNITLTGSGFTGNPAISPTAVNYSGTGVAISSVVVVNDTSITCTLTIAAAPPATSGHLTVTTPSGTSNGANFTVTGTTAPSTPAGFPSFIFGGVTIASGIYVGQRGIYASMQTPVPATAVAGASVTITGTGTYDGTFVVVSASGTDLVLVAGSNSATAIISRQGLIQFP